MGEAAQQRVSGYRIIRKLATGGMAEIYLARLEGAHGFTKNVVLKRILPHLCEEPDFVEMFLQEARLAAQLSHPNIAQVFDIGEEQGRVHYTMEYVDGPELRDIAKRIHARGEPPPLDLAVGVGIAIAAGLHYAHELRDPSGRPLEIVHRDVTPSNILLTYDGVPKLLDFGVAKAKLDGRESTAVGILKGKLPYMSPEQVDGARDLDGRSDIFSLGVVLWELTTLRRLYRSDSQLETIRRIANEDAPAPSLVHPGYPPQLEHIVLRALARDRDQRYASALELQRELEDFAREQRLPVAGTRLAELMGALYGEELDEERQQLEADERERTDSDVFTTRFDSSRLGPGESAPSLPSAPIVLEPEPDAHASRSAPAPEPGAELGARASWSALTQVEAITPAHASATLESEVIEVPGRNRGARIAVALGLVGALALLGWAMIRSPGSPDGEPAPAPAAQPTASPGPAATPATPEAADPASMAAEPGDKQPPAAADDEPGGAPKDTAAPRPEVEPAGPTPASPAKRSGKRKHDNKPDEQPTDSWDKNSLTLPD